MSGETLRDIIDNAKGKTVFCGFLTRDGKPYGYMFHYDINEIIKWATPDIRKLNCELTISVV